MAKATREYIYGINPVFEVLRAGRRTFFEAYLNEATANQPRLRKLHTLLERKQVPVQLVGKQRLHELASSKDHQGVVLKVTTYPYSDLEELLDQPRLLLLDNVEDPHNVGAVIRTAEIFGFSAVLLPKRGSPDIYPSIVKVSSGATEFVRITKSGSGTTYMKEAATNGYTVVALDAGGKVRLDEVTGASIPRLMLVVGGEDRSVGQYILNHADSVVSIPQAGRINSLNASVAAGIAMYALRTAPHPAP